MLLCCENAEKLLVFADEKAEESSIQKPKKDPSQAHLTEGSAELKETRARIAKFSLPRLTPLVLSVVDRVCVFCAKSEKARANAETAAR